MLSTSTLKDKSMVNRIHAKSCFFFKPKAWKLIWKENNHSYALEVTEKNRLHSLNFIEKISLGRNTGDVGEEILKE